MRELVRDLALTLREQVLPYLGSHAGRAHEQEAAGGDVTFAIDACAERPSGPEFQMSVIAGTNEALHGRILQAIDVAMRRIPGKNRGRWRRRRRN